MFSLIKGPFKANRREDGYISLGNNTYITYACKLCKLNISTSDVWILPKDLIRSHEISHANGFVKLDKDWSFIRLGNYRNRFGRMVVESNFAVDEILDVIPQLVFIEPTSVEEFANNLSFIMKKHDIMYGMMTTLGILNSCFVEETQKYDNWEEFAHCVRHLVASTQYKCCRCGLEYDSGMPSREMVQNHFILCFANGCAASVEDTC